MDSFDGDHYPFAVRTGLEPATLGVTGRYSNQLNYRTKNKGRCFEPPTFAKDLPWDTVMKCGKYCLLFKPYRSEIK
jgi:hypothetical protein